MYMEVANMTLEQLNRISSMLGQARMAAHMEKVGRRTYLYAVDEEDFSQSAFGIQFGFDYI